MYHLRNILIKLTHCDDTKKRAHDLKMVRAEENLKVGPAERKTSGINQPIKALRQGRPDPSSCHSYKP